MNSVLRECLTRWGVRPTWFGPGWKGVEGSVSRGIAGLEGSTQTEARRCEADYNRLPCGWKTQLSPDRC